MGIADIDGVGKPRPVCMIHLLGNGNDGSV